MKKINWLLILGMAIWAFLAVVKTVVSLQSESPFDISDVWLFVPVTMIIVWAILREKGKEEKE